MSTSAHAVPGFAAAGARTTRSLRTLYLARAAIAVVWAIALATAGESTSALAIALLIFYPLLDVAASIVDARLNRGTAAATTQYLNTGISLVTAVAMIVAATASESAMVAVFGVWASVSGLIQLFLAVRRRGQLGGQWVMIVSGGLSTLAGINFVIGAGADDFALSNLAGYALFGAVLFVVSALRLGPPRRPR